MRRIARIDGNQRAIVEALRARGCSVLSLATLGRGCPDILVGFRGANVLLEIKNPSKDKRSHNLTPDELAFHRTWRGRVVVVESVAEALAAVGMVA